MFNHRKEIGHNAIAKAVLEVEVKGDSMRTALEDILTIVRGSPSSLTTRAQQIERIADCGLKGNYHNG